MLKKLTHERLKVILDYDPSTGIFTWKKSGRIASRNTGDLCVRIGIDGRRYKLHRLAWFYVTGDWPEHYIDHIDGDVTNNRFSNLREATPSQNQHNRNAKGYCFDKSRGKWMAKLRTNYRQIFLGRFSTPQEARKAYIEGCRKYQDASFIDRKVAAG